MNKEKCQFLDKTKKETSSKINQETEMLEIK